MIATKLAGCHAHLEFVESGRVWHTRLMVRAEYPVGNGFDPQGRMTTMTNWTTLP